MRFLITLAVTLVVLAAVPLSAQTGPNRALFPRFTVTVGGYDGNFATDVRLNPHGAEGGSGSDIDFERDLNMDKSKSLGRVTLTWRPFNRHEVGLGFFRSSRSADRVIDRDINWGDVTFPVNGTVESGFNINYWDLGYTYWLVQGEKSGLGLNGGVSWMSINTRLTAAGSGTSVESSQRASTELPIPVFGLQGRYAFTNKLQIRGRFSFLPQVELSNYSAKSAIGYGAIEYRFFNTIAVGAGYNYLNIEGSVDKDRFDGDLGYTVEGPEVFLRLVFGND